MVKTAPPNVITHIIPGLAGLILAGGHGSRMGFVDKGLLSFNGAPLIRPALDLLQRHCSYVAISANQNIERYQTLTSDVYRDLEPWLERGPLGGMLSSVSKFPHLINGQPIQAIQVLPCDTPFVNDHIICKLTSALQTSTSLAVYATSTKGKHPIICQFKYEALNSLSSFLAEANTNKIFAWLQTIKAQAVNFHEDELFVNFNDINTLKRYSTALN